MSEESEPDPYAAARQLAADSLAENDATGWFERLYSAAEHAQAVVPWDQWAPHFLLHEWVELRGIAGDRRALVVGSGLGRDAEYLARLGFETVAFDVSETAIRATRRRFPDSAVRYVTADLLAPPAGWREAYDLVVESLTVQALPDPPRRGAIEQVANFVAPGGTLLVIAAAREPADAVADGPPWPLTREEILAFAAGGLRPVRIEDVYDDVDPHVHRWRAEFRRPG